MLKTLLRAIASRQLVRGVLVGVGGGVLTAIGWKLGTDIYNLVKRRMRDPAAIPQAEGEAQLEK